MADPFYVQKQIKDNSEDLHNFARDLKLWEEEMKRKDRQLSNDQSEEMLPPVRRAKVSKKALVQKEDKKASKRISSYDYSRWDNFDVEKACEEVDHDGHTSEEENDEEIAKEQKRYQMQKALYEKEKGNRHVKACKWDEAIEAYTRAITSYSKDPIFFANRALCYLKKKQYDKVEADCTESLKLDPTYVKAYLRRAAAHEALGRLENARHDLSQVLQLELNNSQAQRDLDRIKSLIASVDKNKNTLKKDDVKKSVFQESNKQEKSPITRGSNKLNESVSPTPNTKSLTIPASTKEDKNAVNQSTAETETNIKVSDDDSEPWEPCSNTIQPIYKPPHLRSKKSLKRIEILDVQGNSNHIHSIKQKNQSNQSDNISELSRIDHPAASDAPEVGTPSGVKCRSSLTVRTTLPDNTEVPPPPKTSVQFHLSWNGIKADQNLCYKFLKQIPGEHLPNIFKESLESGMFSSIVQVLTSEFIAADESVFQYLKGLSEVRRFSTLVLFMSPTDKTNIQMLFDHCMKKENRSFEDLKQLRKLYEID